MLKKHIMLFLLLQPCLIFSQILSLDMKTLPGGNVSVQGYDVTVSRFQISRTELKAETLALLLNEAQSAGRFQYPLNRAAQIRYLEREKVTVNLSHPSAVLAYRNREIIVRDGLENFPVTEITWEGALFICNLLSIRDGLEPVYNLNDYSCDWSADGYRLPTYAEWKFALGNEGKLLEAPEEYAWGYENCFEEGHSGLNGNLSHAAARKTPNENGLYDMIGNVAEWCWDSPWTVDYVPNESDPKGPPQTMESLVVGGYWETSLYGLEEIPVQAFESQTHKPHIGLRLVRVP